jgi:dTDP-4-amino-4,6-dideoxygalactose transaminase
MTTPPEIPLVDLAAQHEEIAAEVAEGFQRVFAETSFIGGDAVGTFEYAYAAFAAVDHCIGVANGTDALELALRAAGIGPGDEVIVPANTFIATAEAVHRAGAAVTLADCDCGHLVTADALADAITSRTAAMIPVHLYGQMAPMRSIAALAQTAGLAVIEDAAQAQGATQDGAAPGTLGASVGTSFYPGKNLGAYGDGGAVLTNDAAIADTVRLMANHGSAVKYEHRIVGMNSRLDTLQAVVLHAKLRHLADWNAARVIAAARYDALLADVDDVVRPGTADGNQHVWHLYVIKVPPERRDEVVAHLRADGIGAAIHYPVPIHLQPAFASLGYGRGAFPVAEQATSSIVSLPMHPHLSESDQTRVAESLHKAMA